MMDRTLFLTGSGRSVNDRLVKWGKPEEWKAASAGYDINYTPPSSAKR